ncbi:Nose resistant to fluoxetine protein 6 [Stylophora pistillata]|uniref:Nose resistant to fluoxetine protein 6 n=1 Tax=Stylophora pistillata TaxID=50429 RepID=A0A2B4SXJ6_STYPI|nr:Nose resistant to fluoxetine protein 6 [Stylophora pistillata]
MPECCKPCFEAFAVFFVLCSVQKSSSVSYRLTRTAYDEIIRKIGVSFESSPNIFFTLNVSKECSETLANLSLKPDFTKYLDAMGKPQSGLLLGNIGWLGSYSECTKTISDAQYCLAYISFNKTVPIHWGVCVPKQCSEEDVTKALQEIFSAGSNESVVSLDPQPVSLIGNPSHKKPVFCSKPSEYTTGVKLTLILIGLVLLLCLVGTSLDIAFGFMKPNSAPVNKSDGFMPVKEASMATDRDTISDSSNLIHSSTVVSSSSSRILSSYPQEPAKPNLVSRFLLCFSWIQNTNRIMDTNVPPSAITSINGMRVLSMWWVILGHLYSIQMITSISNLRLFTDIIHRFTFQAVGNATFSVDSFFFLRPLVIDNNTIECVSTYEILGVVIDSDLSGLLVAYLALRNMEKKNGELPLFMYYFHRFWRFRLRGLLLIVAVLTGISFVTTAIIYAHYDLAAVQLSPATKAETAAGIDSSSLTYVKPYCRIAPYLVGMLLGYLLVHAKNWKLPSKTKMRLFNMAGWCVAIALALSTLYGEYKVLRKDNPKPFSRAENITYGTFSRFAWSLALAWVVFACQNGFGGLVNKILSARFWIPLSRLTYCAYLVHILAIVALYGSFETVQAYSDVHISISFVGVIGISYAAAFLVSVCVEFPMMQLEKLIFNR